MPQRSVVALPVKTRDLHNHHMDSTIWDRFQFRGDDIIIATYAKSGTTWMQQIVGQLVFDGAGDIEISKLSPWLETRILTQKFHSAAANQTHRRFIKTHLPVDALVFSSLAKYIFVGRDGRDTAWSLYHHHRNMTRQFINVLNLTPGLVGDPLPPCPEDPRQFYRAWFEEDGKPFWPFWRLIRGWWSIRALPNVKLVHFNDLKADLPGGIRAIADFLGIPIDERKFPAILRHCTFGFMKANAAKVSPFGGMPWHGGAETFINRGTNGRWRDFLSSDEIQDYERKAAAELGPDCAAWLEMGSGKRTAD